MKIIHVISSLVKGGGERVTVELANKAVEKGDDVTFIVGWPLDPLMSQNDINSKIKIIYLSNSKISAYLSILPWIVKNRDFLNRSDVLHCHLTYGSFFGCVVNYFFNIFSLKRKFILVETYHAVGMHIPKVNRWIHSIMMLCKDGIVFMARDFYWDQFMKKHKNLRIQVIPNGIELRNTKVTDVEKNEFIKSLFMRKCDHLIGTVGMLRPERKPEIYVALFGLVKEMIGTDDVHFVLGGNGTEYDRIEFLKSEAGLNDTFHMVGLISGDPCILMSKFNIYVSVSVGNTTGVSMIEAAMCKVPVVGVQLLENYIATERDWVWSHTDLRKVAERVVFLLKNEKERQNVIDQQYNYVTTNLTSEAMYLSYDLFYRELWQ